MDVEDRRAVLALVLAFAFGVGLTAFIAARPSTALPNCLCGCPASAHEHNRPGTWCSGRCPRFGDDACTRYEPNRSRPSWADNPPRMPTDGEDVAAEFLRYMALISPHRGPRAASA